MIRTQDLQLLVAFAAILSAIASVALICVMYAIRNRLSRGEEFGNVGHFFGGEYLTRKCERRIQVGPEGGNTPEGWPHPLDCLENVRDYVRHIIDVEAERVRTEEDADADKARYKAVEAFRQSVATDAWKQEAAKESLQALQDLGIAVFAGAIPICDGGRSTRHRRGLVLLLARCGPAPDPRDGRFSVNAQTGSQVGAAPRRVAGERRFPLPPAQLARQ